MKKIFIPALVLCSWSILSFGQSDAMKKLNITMYALNNLYVDKVDNDKLVEDAISALLEKLDPYSNYMNEDEAREMNEPLQGNFDGIGIQFNMLTDTLYIAQVVAGGPSEKVGLLAGDRIITVDDTLIAGVKMKNTDIMKRLRGMKGTQVKIQVLRSGVSDLIEFRIIRDKIPIYSMEASYMANEETGYIRISRFAGTTREEFVKAFKDLQDQGMKHLILDLQGNGGGYLNAAIELSDEFLGEGKLIVYTEGLHQSRKNANTQKKGLFEEGKLVVLIDEYSASASEILSGALQDWDRAVIVGRRSFGKGLVQQMIPFQIDGSMLRLTISRYYTPTGRSIQKPYEKGNSASYGQDLINRYNRGEMVSADSIHFPDSLKFSTLVSGRTVYGGGGIMPDYFVPIDTTRYTAWHRNVIAKGTLNKLNLNFVDRNREVIKNACHHSFEEYKAEYAVPESLMQELQEAALSDSIKFDQEEYNRSEALIKLQFKALIARDVFEKNEYYIRIINEDNESFKKALTLLNDPEEYEKLLGKVDR
ncbi:MAG: S41 family peptidase [Dysgonamonadaceae bacterium]|jgi:carboxyl-terminal processing protease|nr:S41 family peptidase [Dysgonamonadaceae bacterium]